MKTTITLCIAFLTVALSTNAQTKLGTVNSDLIISKMPQLKTVQEGLQKYGARLDSINNVKVASFETLVKTYNDDLPTLNEAAKKIRANEIQLLDKELAALRQNGNQMMQLQKNELMRPLYAKVTEIVTDIAKEKGYTQILTTSGNEFVFIDTAHDITELVLAKLGIKE